ncbi:MAG: glycoside hydrolase family 28 protein [Verrucomicrobiota bacterium JB022]|nr:glycoside hydrolase family 28 protein [Verrucomicrobiota bacterium JB022]
MLNPLRLPLVACVLAALSFTSAWAEPQQLPPDHTDFWGIDPTQICGEQTERYTDLSPYFEMPDLEVPAIPNRTFNIRDYGAKAGGETKVTQAIADAVQAASKAGGGRVVIPEGRWLTGPIHLRSNIELHVEKGATVLFSTDLEDYLPVVFSRWEGMELYNYSPPIYVNGATNVAVTGDGVFDGQGKMWWDWRRPLQPKAVAQLYQMVLDGVPPNERIFGDNIPGLRPNFIQFIGCRNVLIENVTFINGPMWTIHPVYTTNLIVRGVKVVTEGPNNDGINPDSSQNILIEDCYFSTGDDCVVLKAGLNEDGWRVGRPTQNVVIRRIYANAGHGGVVVGSEMSGSVRNVYAHDSYFLGTDRGIRVKSMRGRGGVVENFWVERIKMKDIGREAIRLNEFYGASTVKPLTQVPPHFRNFTLRDIECDGANHAVLIDGLPERPVSDIKLENVHIRAKRGFSATDAEGITARNVVIEPQEGPAFYLKNTREVEIVETRQPNAETPLLQVEGEQSGGIVLKGAQLQSPPEKAVAVGPEVPAKAVQFTPAK